MKQNPNFPLTNTPARAWASISVQCPENSSFFSVVNSSLCFPLASRCIKKQKGTLLASFARRSGRDSVSATKLPALQSEFAGFSILSLSTKNKKKRKKEEEKEKRVIKHRREERSKVAGLKMRVERAKRKKKNESGGEEKITQLKGILPPARVVMRAETRVNPSVRGHFLKRDTFATEQRENERRPSKIFRFLRISVTTKNGCVLF